MVSIESVRKYCKRSDIPFIENYQQAIADKENMWECHHRLELHPDGTERFSRESLKKLDLLNHRPHTELIFLRFDVHQALHKHGKAKSEFGRKYIEHYGFGKRDNVKLYDHEKEYYRYHGHCSWEA